MTKRTPIIPMLNLMFIRLTPLRNKDYVRLASEMHKKDMKLVMDYVVNHWEHWMMKDLPTQDWIHQFENYTQTNHKRSTINDSNASK
jgi:glycosidase